MATSTETTTAALSMSQTHIRDYAIQLSGGPGGITLQPPPVTSSATAPNPSQQEVAGQADLLSRIYRAVPPTRPANRSLDRASRPWGSNNVESVIVFILMHGGWLKASVARLWNMTGGKLNDELFREKIPGVDD
ncbi:hypothetical protein QBC35DRAFT_482104 [Podospora australis]|uniref:Uncharacterized protein n=1 Tax=Podospora australis TaxID=1536484 RepID=A0AAN7API0_9PEZI|nr:hypothetical protein QBC35DRAFT_482104 [Podospora australis]